MRIKILGAGSWGTALALLLHDNGHEVSLWSWEEEHVRQMLRDHENKNFLPGIRLPNDLEISSDYSDIAFADIVSGIRTFPSRKGSNGAGKTSGPSGHGHRQYRQRPLFRYWETDVGSDSGSPAAKIRSWFFPVPAMLKRLPCVYQPRSYWRETICICWVKFRTFL